jgi:hypothetical protein
MMKQLNHLRIAETAMTIFWFAMDLCWMNQWMKMSAVMSILAVACGAGIFALNLLNRHEEFLVHTATLCWLMMNACWMFSEANPNLLILANTFMIMGAALIIVMGIIDHDALAYFRRLRKR